MVLDRISTGLSGLDSLIEGGIPRGFTVLIAGNPGTGKTILTAHFLYEGLTKGENALYVSFSESKEQFNDNTGRLNMNFIEHEKKGNFVYLDFASITREGMRDALDEILATLRERNVKRIVVDSFSAIAQAYDKIIDARIVLQTILGKMMRAEGVTTFLIAEVPFGQKSIGTGIEEFVADGIIHLSHGRDNSAPMMLSVVKMRGTSVNREPHIYTIGRNGGMIYQKQGIKLTYEASRKRISVGIPNLDSKIGSGILAGTTTALLGAAGVGKTTFAFQFLADGVKNGEPGIYISLEESGDEIRRMGEGYGFDMRKLEKDGLTIVSRNAEEQHPDAIMAELVELIKKTKAKRMVVDSLTSFVHLYKDDIFMITKQLSSLSREYGTTTMFTVLIEQQAGLSLTDMGVSSIFQNIILLRYFEVEGKMKRSMILLKMRSTHVDDSILEFSIMPGTISKTGGIAIVGSMENYTGILSGIAQRLKIDYETSEKRVKDTHSFERNARFAKFSATERKIEQKENEEKSKRKLDLGKRLKESKSFGDGTKRHNSGSKSRGGSSPKAKENARGKNKGRRGK
jgi:circadian clock protein KaiC